jgi:N-acetylgalactosamine-6-sulfatase
MDYFHHVEDPPRYEPVLRLNGAPVKRPGYFTEIIAEECGRWIRGRDGGQPLFLYVPFTAPHSPYQAPGENSPAPLAEDSMRWKQGTAPPEVYAAMIESMDAAIGRILDALAETPQGKGALVVFASDNGGTKSSLPCGLRDQKGTTFEGGIRVPCIARWPGAIPNGITYAHPVLLFDLTASFAKIGGASPDAARPFDGVDILPFVASGKPPPPRTLFWRGRRGDRTWRAARDGDLKFVSRTDGPKSEEFLFDIARDLGESNNLLGDRPAEAERLKGLLQQWEERVRPTR